MNPTVTEIPFDHKIVSLSVERDALRSPGVHLSHITKDMLITAGVKRFRESKKGAEEAAKEQHYTFEQGFLWERLVTDYIQTPYYQAQEWDWYVKRGLTQLVDDAIQGSGGTILRPGEVVMDGIAMTPDAINQRLFHLEEWKSTSIRSDGFDIAKRRVEWLWQVAAYARYFNMTRAIIRVWFYGEFPPTVKNFVIEFSTADIEENWTNILNHWNYMKSRGQS